MSKIILIILMVLVAYFMFSRSQNSKKAAAENIEEGKLFLTDNSNKEGIKTTESGLQFQQISAGTGTEHPTATDSVKVHYHGTLLDGTVFDSSVDRGEPISFPLNRVIKGWTEGLQLMVVGEKTRLFIPSDLAYGNQSVGNIEPGSTLIFEVELLAINE